MCREALVIGPYSELYGPHGPRNIYLPTRSTEQKVHFPFKLSQSVSKIQELKHHKLKLTIPLRKKKDYFFPLKDAYAVLIVTPPFLTWELINEGHLWGTRETYK